MEMQNLRFGPPFFRNVFVHLGPPAFWQRLVANKYDPAIAEEVSMGRRCSKGQLFHVIALSTRGRQLALEDA